MKTPYGRFIIFAVILTLLFTIGDVILTYQNLVIIFNNTKLVNRAYAVNSELDRTLIALINAETGERGYLLTNDESYLQPYQQSTPVIQKHIATIENLTRDNSFIQKRINILKQDVNQRLSLLQQGINAINTQGLDASQSFIQTEEDQGKQKMNEIRNIIISLENNEMGLLALRKSETDHNYTTLFVTSAFTGILNIVLILLTYYLINREFAKRTELEKNKDEFFNLASHELKTPITSLNIYLHVLLKKINENQKIQAKRYIAKIEAQTTKLNSLITDFLDLARIQTGKMKYEYEKFNLDVLIKDTRDEIQGITNKHKIIIKGKIGKLIEADRYRIYQVLVNLITNAIKYSPDGGKVIISTQRVKDMVTVSIEDFGIGIEPKYQDKIFDRLYQINVDAKTSPGFGIGLFVSKEIVKFHKGKIWVESYKGKGSTFYFQIPIHK